MKHTLRATAVAVLSFTFLSSFAATPATALTIPVKSEKGKVEFHAVGRPSLIKINGEGKGPEGSLKVTGAKVEGDLTFDMTSLNSGISMRDTHMKEKYLETGKFPQAKLHLTEVSLPADWAPGKAEAKDRDFKGDLTLHGVTKPVTGKFDVSGAATALNAKARFEINIADFGVEIPKYLGITVRNEVPVELTMNDMAPTP